MKAAARRDEIARLARETGLASVEELAQRFDVSSSTIRRDLALLEESQAIARTYGGVIPIPASHAEGALHVRAREGMAAKQAIGRWAAQQVQPGQTILLDAGTTCAQMARELRHTTPLTVVTTGLTPLFELAHAPEVDRVLLGGSFREISQGFVGPVTEQALERWTFDAVFLGADAVTAELGVCEASPAQTRLKELMARTSSHVHLLVHGEKIGQRPFNSWVQLPPGWTLVTDSSADPAHLEPFRGRGVRVVVAD